MEGTSQRKSMDLEGKSQHQPGLWISSSVSIARALDVESANVEAGTLDIEPASTTGALDVESASVGARAAN